MAEEEQAGNRKGLRRSPSVLVPLLLGLLVAFSLTSGLLGFQLGRRAMGSTGELIDTIVLSPGEGAAGSAVTHFLTGKVLNTQGDPCAGVAVRFEESGKGSIANASGKFYISDVRSGSHVLEILQDGQLLASTNLSLNFTGESGARADADEAGASSFEMPRNTQVLEVTLQVGENGVANIDTSASYLVTTEGDVVNFSGEYRPAKEDTFAVTPQGNVAAPSGVVVLPASGVAITPVGMAEVIEPGDQPAPGLLILEDGAVQTPEGVTVLPQGIVTAPDGSEAGGASVVVIDGTSVEETPVLPEEFPVPSPGEEANSTPAPTASPADAFNAALEATPGATPQNAPSGAAQEGQEDEPSVEEEGPGSSDAADPPESAATPAPEATPTPKAALQMADSSLVWQQQSMIDLFRNRTQDQGLGEENGVPVIAPGSSGFYEFQLKNEDDFAIDFTISLVEGSFHLPIVYSIQDAETDEYFTGLAKTGEQGGEDGKVATSVLRIAPNSIRHFRINWEWQYEDWYNPDDDDLIDTQATQGDRTYILAVDIAAEQAEAPPAFGDGTRYPGQRKEDPNWKDKIKR